MYSPTTRLLTVLELLQSYQQLSGTELARRLEVDGRTVRRYIVRLQEMGIPVEAEYGPHGCYRLRRGYKMPPLMLTDAETVALTLGLMAIRDLHLPVDVAAVEGALAKTERVMPQPLHERARALQEAITFHSRHSGSSAQPDTITALSSAIYQQYPVEMRYRTGTEQESLRTLNPYGIVVHEGVWYLAGFCHLRQDLRTFRVDRILSLSICPGHFEKPTHFNTLAYILQALNTGPEQEQIEILLKTTLTQAQKLMEPVFGSLTETHEGIVFRRAAYHLDWVAHFLLSLDVAIEVRHPPALRTALQERVNRGLEMLA